MKKLFKRNLAIFLALVIFMPLIFVLSACGPAEDQFPDDAIQITNDAELIDAINNQEENQYWVLKSGTYNINPNETTITYADLTGWYLPIVKKGITIHGKGEVVLTSSIESINGGWNGQNFITIVGDNVTIRNVKIVCKKEVNKAIEILGKNATIKNVVFDAPAGFDFAGSIYLHPTAIAENTEGNVGTLTLENVKLNKGRITGTGANSGKIIFKNVEIDWTGIEEECLEVYPIQSFNGKDFDFDGAKTVEVKLSATELGARYDEAISNMITGVKVVNIDA